MLCYLPHFVDDLSYSCSICLVCSSEVHELNVLTFVQMHLSVTAFCLKYIIVKLFWSHIVPYTDYSAFISITFLVLEITGFS